MTTPISRMALIVARGCIVSKHPWWDEDWLVLGLYAAAALLYVGTMVYALLAWVFRWY